MTGSLKRIDSVLRKSVLPKDGKQRLSTVKGRRKWTNMMSIDRATINRKYFALECSTRDLAFGFYRRKPLGHDRYGRSFWYLGGTPQSGRGMLFIRDTRNTGIDDTATTKLVGAQIAGGGQPKNRSKKRVLEERGPITSQDDCPACNGQHRSHTCSKRRKIKVTKRIIPVKNNKKEITTSSNIITPKKKLLWHGPLQPPKWKYLHLYGEKNTLLPLLTSLWINGRNESRLHVALTELYQLHKDCSVVSRPPQQNDKLMNVDQFIVQENI